MNRGGFRSAVGDRNADQQVVRQFTQAIEQVDAGLRYSIMPGLTWTPRVAYGDFGQAVATNDRKAQDAWAVINRIIYFF